MISETTWRTFLTEAVQDGLVNWNSSGLIQNLELPPDWSSYQAQTEETQNTKHFGVLKDVSGGGPLASLIGHLRVS